MTEEFEASQGRPFKEINTGGNKNKHVSEFHHDLDFVLVALNIMSSDTFKLYSQAIKRKPLPDDPVTRADVEHVLEYGYVVLPDCFTKAEAKEARNEIIRLLGKDPLGGRNPFEGLNTNRIYSLLNKSRVFDKFVILPRVLALNDYFLDPGYLLSAFHTISINPGEKAQALHHDDGYIQFPRPRLPFGAAIMVALDEYTASNGDMCFDPDLWLPTDW